MNKCKAEFDESIKEKFLAGSPVLPGISIENDKVFGRDITLRGKKKFHDTYFSDDYGNEMLSMLSSEIKKCYKEGKGGEFEYKFFSVGSSSRFAVASFTQNNNGNLEFIETYKEQFVKNIEFEKGLRIDNISGIPPQMDVWIRTDSDVFFEVKCHEIFDETEHSTIKLSGQYKNNTIFMDIVQHYNIDLSTKEYITKKTNGGSHTDYILNRNMFGVCSKSSRFDLKQFICHLMGIVSFIRKENKKDVKFIYLFFKNPDKRFEKVYEELENEIDLIQESFEWFFKKYGINFSFVYNDEFSTLK